MEPVRDELPRPLTAREAEILDFMLAVDDPRVAALRDQRMTAVVTGTCGCGCATVHLAVDRSISQPARLCGQPLSATLDPASAALGDPNEAYGVLIFLDEWWLASLEIWWTEKPPAEFPPATAFSPPEVTCERDDAALTEMRRDPTIGAVHWDAEGRMRTLKRARHPFLDRWFRHGSRRGDAE